MQNKEAGFLEEDAFVWQLSCWSMCCEMSPEHIWFKGNTESQVARIVATMKAHEKYVVKYKLGHFSFNLQAKYRSHISPGWLHVLHSTVLSAHLVK